MLGRTWTCCLVVAFATVGCDDATSTPPPGGAGAAGGADGATASSASSGGSPGSGGAGGMIATGGSMGIGGMAMGGMGGLGGFGGAGGAGGLGGMGGGSSQVADFSLLDVNSTSPTFAQPVSPRDHLMKVSGWYFGHAT